MCIDGLAAACRLALNKEKPPAMEPILCLLIVLAP